MQHEIYVLMQQPAAEAVLTCPFESACDVAFVPDTSECDHVCLGGGCLRFGQTVQ